MRCCISRAEGLRCFHLNRYVCQRDPMGNPLEVITCEQLAISTLPKKVQDMVRAKDDDDDITSGIIDDIVQPVPRKDSGDTVRIYTYVTWERNSQGKKGTVKWHQEVNNKIIPGSEGRAPEDVSPWLPLRMTRSDGQQCMELAMSRALHWQTSRPLKRCVRPLLKAALPAARCSSW